MGLVTATAYCALRTARTRRNGGGPALRRSAPSGSPRPLGVRALWESAPFGSPRRQAVRAVRQFPSPYLNTVIGSTLVALLTGTSSATAALASSTRTASPSATGSNGATP